MDFDRLTPITKSSAIIEVLSPSGTAPEGMTIVHVARAVWREREAAWCSTSRLIDSSIHGALSGAHDEIARGSGSGHHSACSPKRQQRCLNLSARLFSRGWVSEGLPGTKTSIGSADLDNQTGLRRVAVACLLPLCVPADDPARRKNARRDRAHSHSRRAVGAVTPVTSTPMRRTGKGLRSPRRAIASGGLAGSNTQRVPRGGFATSSQRPRPDRGECGRTIVRGHRRDRDLRPSGSRAPPRSKHPRAVTRDCDLMAASRVGEQFTDARWRRGSSPDPISPAVVVHPLSDKASQFLGDLPETQSRPQSVIPLAPHHRVGFRRVPGRSSTPSSAPSVSLETTPPRSTHRAEPRPGFVARVAPRVVTCTPTWWKRFRSWRSSSFFGAFRTFRPASAPGHSSIRGAIVTNSHGALCVAHLVAPGMNTYPALLSASTNQ